MTVEGTWALYVFLVAELCTFQPSLSTCSEALTCMAAISMVIINNFFM